GTESAHQCSSGFCIIPPGLEAAVRATFKRAAFLLSCVVLRAVNQPGMKTPRTGAGRLRFSEAPGPTKAAPEYDAMDSRKPGCLNLYRRVSELGQLTMAKIRPLPATNPESVPRLRYDFRRNYDAEPKVDLAKEIAMLFFYLPMI